MRFLLGLLVLTAACWAQGPSIEFACEPPDTQVYRQDGTLLGQANQPVPFPRSGLPEELVLVFKRPGWVPAERTVKRKDLEGPRYPAKGRGICLIPGISLQDRAHQFWFAASACLPWIGVIVVITALLGIGQKAMEKRQKLPPRPLGSGT